MFSGNEWVILVLTVAVLAVPVAIIVAVIVGSNLRRASSPAEAVAFTGAAQPRPAEPSTPAGWFPDPSGRHDQRYWNGSAWTASVVTSGEPGTDVL